MVIKTFADNGAVQVIEASIVNNLANIFNLLAVAQITSELISKMTAGPQENQSQRELLERKLYILMDGLNT